MLLPGLGGPSITESCLFGLALATFPVNPTSAARPISGQRETAGNSGFSSALVTSK